jgi:ferredoxin-thioredoxin reductase catalytic subunit
MTEQEIRAALVKFTEGKEFELNPDKEHVDFIIRGIMANAEAKGLKYCPCRIPVGNFEKDLELVCPCNFFSHTTWNTQGRCWCGLFTRRK